ncbi:MAG: hypothetical protein RL120_17800 [Gammaproteobacteria bacterium]
MIQAVKAGLLYFFGVICAGILLGGIRLMLLVPTLGDTLAVSIEVPVMLLLCWILCGRAIALFEIVPQWPDRLLMGVVAFCCLLTAEWVLAIVLFGQTTTQFLASFLLAAGLIGLAGQVLFACLPLLHMLLYRNKRQRSARF